MENTASATSQGCATCPRRFECLQYMELVGLAVTVRFLYQSLRKVVGPAFLPLAEADEVTDET